MPGTGGPDEALEGLDLTPNPSILSQIVRSQKVHPTFTFAGRISRLSGRRATASVRAPWCLAVRHRALHAASVRREYCRCVPPHQSLPGLVVRSAVALFALLISSADWSGRGERRRPASGSGRHRGHPHPAWSKSMADRQVPIARLASLAPGAGAQSHPGSHQLGAGHADQAAHRVVERACLWPQRWCTSRGRWHVACGCKAAEFASPGRWARA